jgi:hypothetical protein
MGVDFLKMEKIMKTISIVKTQKLKTTTIAIGYCCGAA